MKEDPIPVVAVEAHDDGWSSVRAVTKDAEPLVADLPGIHIGGSVYGASSELSQKISEDEVEVLE